MSADALCALERPHESRRNARRRVSTASYRGTDFVTSRAFFFVAARMLAALSSYRSLATEYSLMHRLDLRSVRLEPALVRIYHPASCVI